MTATPQVRQQIADLVNACNGYWELRGIPPRQRQEMRLELDQHLAQAIRVGKSLESVVGPNALEFAEAWAREMPHRSFQGIAAVVRWAVLDWLPLALGFVVLVALFEHVVLLSPTFAFNLTQALGLVLIGVFTILRGLAGFLAPSIANRENRQRLALGIYVAISLLVLLVLRLTGAPLDEVLFHWTWRFTVVLAVATGILLGVKYYLSRVA